MDETVAAEVPLHNPMTETWWPPAVMASWVVWRTPGEVQRCWHINREQPTTLSDVLAMEQQTFRFYSFRADHVPAVAPAEQARDEIERALYAGRLRAEGVVRGEVLFKPLPVLIWQAVPIRIQRLNSSDQDRWHDALFRDGDPEPIVTTARFLREDVMREWPDPTAGAETDTSAAQQSTSTSPSGNFLEKTNPAEGAPETFSKRKSGRPQKSQPYEVAMLQALADGHSIGETDWVRWLRVTVDPLLAERDRVAEATLPSTISRCKSKWRSTNNN